MKILSINRDRTIDENQIALNLDHEVTPEFMTRLDYGGLSLTAEGTVLMVYKEEEDEAFSQDFIAALQAKLNAAQEALDQEAKKRKIILERLAASTSLPLN